MARGKATFDTMPTVDVESNLRVSPTVDVSNRVNPDMRDMNPARSLDGELDDLASSLELDPVQMRAHEKEVVRGGYGDYKHLPKKSLDDEMMVFKGESFLDDIEEKGASSSLQKLVKGRRPTANLTNLRTRGALRKDLREVVRGTKGRSESIHPEASMKYSVKELSSNIVVKEQEAVPVGLAIRDLRRLDRMTNYLKKRGQQYENYDEEPTQEDQVQPKELSDDTMVTKGVFDVLKRRPQTLVKLRQSEGRHLLGRRPNSWDKPVPKDPMRINLGKRPGAYDQPVKELDGNMLVTKSVGRVLGGIAAGGAIGGTLGGLTASRYAKSKDKPETVKDAVIHGAFIGGIMGGLLNRNSVAAAGSSAFAGVASGAETVLMKDRKMGKYGKLGVKELDSDMMVTKGAQFAHRVKQTVTSRQHMKDLMKKKGFEEDLEVKFAKKLVQGAKSVLNKVIKPKPVPVAPRTAGTNVFRNSTKPAVDFHVDPKGTATASAPPKATPTEKPPTTQANQKKPNTGPGAAAGTDFQGPKLTGASGGQEIPKAKRVDPTNPPRKPLSKPVKYGLIGGALLGTGYGASQLMQNSEPEYPQMTYQGYKGDIQQKAFKCVMRPESRSDLHAALAKIGKLKTRS